MTEVSDLQKELSEIRSEMLKLTRYLSATREKLAQLEAKDRPAPSYSDALKMKKCWKRRMEGRQEEVHEDGKTGS